MLTPTNAWPIQACAAKPPFQSLQGEQMRVKSCATCWRQAVVLMCRGLKPTYTACHHLTEIPDALLYRSVLFGS
jgi:hypothetical protein